MPRPPKLKACPCGEAARQEESPAVISLVVSRCQKNSQVWEKTYPGCRGVESGDSMAGLRIRTSSRLPRRAKPGGRRRRPAARVASPVASGGQDSFLSFASVLPSLRFREQQTLFLHWIEKGACLHGQTHTAFKPSPNNPARFCQGPAGGLRGNRKRGRGRVSRQGPELPETAGGGEVREAALSSPPGFASLSLFFIAAARSCLR